MGNLKAKNLNWLAGRPVMILDNKTAIRLNIHVDERVAIRFGSKKLYAVVDIFSNLVKENQIGLSHEVTKILKTKNNSSLEISHSVLSQGAALINKKIEGKELSQKEIEIIIREITNNNLTESEIAFFVAAEKIQGMSSKEVIALTESMIKTGRRLKFNKKIVADKHCIGGIAGNRTTPIVVSICAAAGLTIPKNSSRAITSAAGTADVVETITGVEFLPQKIKSIVKETNACLVWNGTLNLSPSDDKIIHVERILNLDVEPQLLASIMSKKISAGSNHVLIDIPFNGGKVKKRWQARKLGKKFRQIAKHFNIKLKAVYTDGRQPIGNGVGPILEMKDIIQVLQNSPDAPQDLKEKSIYLSIKLMQLCKIKNPEKKAREILESGQALEKFKQIVWAQDGKISFEKKVAKLKVAKFSHTIRASKSGLITKISNRKTNALCRVLGTPETKSAGVYFFHKLGKIKKGEKIFTMYSESKSKLDDGLRFLKEFELFRLE